MTTYYVCVYVSLQRSNGLQMSIILASVLPGYHMLISYRQMYVILVLWAAPPSNMIGYGCKMFCVYVVALTCTLL